MAEKKGMKSGGVPKEHFERDQPQVAVGGSRYASEMGNPEDLSRSAEGLASYVKKNKMKY